MNVLIVDDHNLFRSGLRFLLSDLHDSLRFIETGTIEDAVALPDPTIDLILLDLTLPDASGLDGLASIRSRFNECTIVVLSGDEDPALVRRCIEAGASGFIPKSSTPDVLVQALRLILAGGTYLPLLAMQQTGERLSGPTAKADTAGGDLHQLLTPRQTDALMLAVRGKPNKSIAQELGISEGTVKLHLSAAFKALGVKNRTEAVFMVAEQASNENRQ